MGRILITGGAGLLGSHLVSLFGSAHELRAVYRDHPVMGVPDQVCFDLADERAEMKTLFAGFRPDCVVHCAAMTKVDYCQEHPREAFAANAGCVQRMLAVLPCETRFIYVSTDSVFDGSKGGYREDDLPGPLNVYASSKLAGEDYLRKRGGDYLVVRTNFFGINAAVPGTSFVEWILGNLRANKSIPLFTDVVFNPLSAATLAETILRLIDSEVKGILHLGSAGALSKYEFGCRLAGHLGLDVGLIRRASAQDVALAAVRPRNTSLDTGWMRQCLGHVPTIDEELSRFCDDRGIKGQVCV